MTTETVFLELPDVRVTNTKVTISGTTYFLPNITSVKLREDRGMRTTGIIIGVFALLLLLGAVAGHSVGAGVFGAAGLLVAVLMGLDGVSYDLLLTTGAAEQQALHSRDKALLTRVMAAINVAVEQRHAQ